MDIVLADTHRPILGKAQATPNLGLLYLAAYATQHRPDLRFHYIPQKHSWSYHLEQIAALKVQGNCRMTQSGRLSLLGIVSLCDPSRGFHGNHRIALWDGPSSRSRR
jgi:hypothetical protein